MIWSLRLVCCRIALLVVLSSCGDVGERVAGSGSHEGDPQVGQRKFGWLEWTASLENTDPDRIRVPQAVCTRSGTARRVPVVNIFKDGDGVLWNIPLYRGDPQGQQASMIRDAIHSRGLAPELELVIDKRTKWVDAEYWIRVIVLAMGDGTQISLVVTSESGRLVHPRRWWREESPHAIETSVSLNLIERSGDFYLHDLGGRDVKLTRAESTVDEDSQDVRLFNSAAAILEKYLAALQVPQERLVVIDGAIAGVQVGFVLGLLDLCAFVGLEHVMVGSLVTTLSSLSIKAVPDRGSKKVPSRGYRELR